MDDLLLFTPTKKTHRAKLENLEMDERYHQSQLFRKKL